VERDPLWKVLLARHGVDIGINSDLVGFPSSRVESLWWKDIHGIGVGESQSEDWFRVIAIKRLGNRGGTRLWHYVWWGDSPFLPRFFSLSDQRSCLISKMGNWVDSQRCWRLIWRRSFFAWEQEGVGFHIRG